MEEEDEQKLRSTQVVEEEEEENVVQFMDSLDTYLTLFDSLSSTLRQVTPTSIPILYFYTLTLIQLLIIDRGGWNWPVLDIPWVSRESTVLYLTSNSILLLHHYKYLNLMVILFLALVDICIAFYSCRSNFL